MKISAIVNRVHLRGRWYRAGRRGAGNEGRALQRILGMRRGRHPICPTGLARREPYQPPRPMPGSASIVVIGKPAAARASSLASWRLQADTVRCRASRASATIWAPGPRLVRRWTPKSVAASMVDDFADDAISTRSPRPVRDHGRARTPRDLRLEPGEMKHLRIGMWTRSQHRNRCQRVSVAAASCAEEAR